ncbi:hypothetical protein ACIP3A_03490 [Streptomyces tricolor]|uniref:hypothetical protein n=1 Tax=Streptomyces TaxID=1883 RepID=UPI000A825CC5|nr:hypothetical protein [Streptomyces sp. PBH53]
MGASSDGYTVKSGMSGQAKELDGAGDDAGHIAEAVRPGRSYTDNVLGGPESAEAFNAFATAWETEATTLGSALHELAGKVRLAKGAYRGSDHAVATRAAAVPAGGGTLTTMPTPAGDSALTTMPVYAERPSALTGY